MEKIDNTDYRWFKEDMRQFSGDNVYKLPEDHHELMAMVAPRALLVTGNTDFTWLSNRSCYVSARAAHEVYKTFGIGDRFGFYIDGGHGHCAVPASQLPSVEAFVERFLKGNNAANTNVTVSPYPDLDYMRWIKWWGSGNPVLPAEPIGTRLWMEAECGIVGSNWETLNDPLASNGKYVVVNGLNSTASAPAGAAASVVIPFNIYEAGPYNLMARLNCPTANDDSYWIKVDNGSFVTYNGLGTSGWQWLKLLTANFTVGAHSITIAYREDGAKMDKIALTTTGADIVGMGTVGANCGGVAPAITAGQIFNVSETATIGSVLGIPAATDADENTVFQNWKITGGTGADYFAIDIATGELSVVDSASFDFESATRSYTLTLTVTDGFNISNEETITIHLTNANDNIPVVNPNQSFQLDGGNCNLLGIAKASDADDTNDPGFTTFQNWQITGGTGAGIFAINAATGVISIEHPQLINFNNSSYSLQVTVSDGLFTSVAETVMIPVNDKQYVCHKGKLIHIDKLSAMDHIMHGDCIGSCATPARNLSVSKPIDEPVETISVYPNPAKNILNIDLGENLHKINSIEMLDLSGKKMSQVSVNGRRKMSISLNGFLPGVYLVRMNGTQVISKKIVVQ